MCVVAVALLRGAVCPGAERMRHGVGAADGPCAGELGPTDKLTEVRDNQMERGWLRPDDWMRSLDKEWRRAGEHTLPAGQQLQVTINDIKLAGSFEPWRRFDQQDIRIMKDIYPPHVDLHYKLLAADGSVIREGDAKLRDGAYLQHAIGSTSDPLRYDKRLIDDWVRHEFAAR